MRRSRRRAEFVPGLFALAALLWTASRLVAEAEPKVAASDGRAAVVVELFTSQGCATCPPADRLLTRLAAESRGGAGGERAGVVVVPLAFHVDSWNHAGWTDPFSDAAWTRRHAFYARKLAPDGAYTPQAVVDGAAALVGSDEVALRAAIGASARRPGAKLDLELLPGATSVVANVAVEVPQPLGGERLELWLAVYETGLETPVERGENGGKRLHDDYVVRSLVRAGKLAAETAMNGPERFRNELRLAKGWRRDRLGVAAFVQDPRTLAIHGARAASLAGG